MSWTKRYLELIDAGYHADEAAKMIETQRLTLEAKERDGDKSETSK